MVLRTVLRTMVVYVTFLHPALPTSGPDEAALQVFNYAMWRAFGERGFVEKVKFLQELASRRLRSHGYRAAILRLVRSGLDSRLGLTDMAFARRGNGTLNEDPSGRNLPGRAHRASRRARTSATGTRAV